MGAASTSSGSSVVPISGEVVSSEMVLPFTLTVSEAAPGTSVMLTVDIFAISTTTVVWLFLNPGRVNDNGVFAGNEADDIEGSGAGCRRR